MFARFRRKRIHPVLRDLLQETHLSVNDFIYPLFAKSGTGIKEEVGSMPGVFQMSIDEIVKECDALKRTWHLRHHPLWYSRYQRLCRKRRDV